MSEPRWYYFRPRAKAAVHARCVVQRWESVWRLVDEAMGRPGVWG